MVVLRYFVCYKDEASGFRRLLFLKQKSEIKTTLEQFLAEVKTQEHVIKSFRSHGGREFDNQEIRKLLAGVDFRVGPLCSLYSMGYPRENIV